MLNMNDGFPLEMKFPYPKPVTPNWRKMDGHSLLLQRPAVEDCSCVDHGLTPELSYMRYLRAKDEDIYNQILTMRRAMTFRASDMLNHPCPNEDAKMRALHAMDYKKRGYSPGCYTSLKPAKMCEIGTPIEPLETSIAMGYRDPSLFPLLPKVRHIVKQ